MRRIKKALISFISFVPKGANKLRAVYKADGQFEVGALSKLDEQGELTAVVYAPNFRDSQGDIADAEVVKQMAHDFIANGANIDIRHDNKPVDKDRARVAESFIVQKDDGRFQDWKDTDGNAVDLTGAWATVIKIDDPSLREKFRSGEWAGVSMGGTAIVEQEKADSFDRLVDALSKAINPPAQTTPNQDDDSMTPEQFKELQKTMAEGFAEITKAVTAKPEEKPKPADPKPEPVTKEKKAPAFKGKLSDKTAVRKHALETQLFNLEKDLDWNDQESVDEFLEKSEEIAEEIAELEKEIAERKSSRVGPAQRGESRSGAPAMMVAGLTKEDQDALAIGMSLGDALNEEFGFGDTSKKKEG